MHDDDIKSEVKKLRIGSKIRDLRRQAGFILENLSQQTGLSKSLLSQIEKGVICPPIATLLKISKALNVNISFFIRDNEPEESIMLVKKEESRAIDSRYFGREEGGYYYEALAFKKAEKHMEPFLVEFKRIKVDKLSYLSHGGEEFLHVLEGTIEFRTEKKCLTLDPGDSLYFESSVPHAYRALGKRNAKALCVFYPQG